MLQGQMTKNVRKKGKFSIILREDDSNQCSYKIKYLEPFRSYQAKPRKIRCIETGQIFKSAREAGYWVEANRKIPYCDMNLIKQACKGKQKTSYGYHWEFVEDSENVL